jgi:hypothetical protein
VKLLSELCEGVSFIQEATEEGGAKRLYIEGIFMMGDHPNRNNRVYPVATLEKEVGRYIKENVDKSRAYGELGHPATPTINLDRVAIHIKSLVKEGKNFVGRALVASTPSGNIVRGLIEDGANLGVSSRGLGSLKQVKEGLNEVQSDFYLATPADVVADPSAHDAFVQGIMENVEYWYDAAKGTYSEQRIDGLKKEIKTLTIEQIEKRRQAMFESFIRGLSKTR